VFRRIDNKDAMFRIGAILFLVVVIIPLAKTPVTHPIKSPEQTREMLSRLGRDWAHPGPPVVLFTRSGCAPSDRLAAELRARGVPYLCVDIDQDSVGRIVHRDLGRNYVGTIATLATPTTVVGTRVVRGADLQAIMEAVHQESWPER
jgi:hypothetical protein